MQDDSQNDQNLVQNSQRDNSLPTQQQPINNPVSAPAKEVEPVAFNQDKQTENYIEVSEKEPQITPEIESAGVYKVSDKIKLDQQARDAGLSEAKESTPVSTTPSGNIKLPMDGVEAKIESKGNTGDANTWIGKLVLFVLQKIGIPARGEAKRNG